MADLDIEETNRLRAALGMTLLPTSSKSTSNLDFKTHATKNGHKDEEEDAGSTLESRSAAAEGNWKKLQEAEQRKKRKAEQRAAQKKQIEAAQRSAKLTGKGLGDEDVEEDTRSWLLGGKKRQKKIAKSRAEQEERELAKSKARLQYTERDLAGQKVAHELADFDEEGEHILTLKDTAIGEESEEDELENAELRERDKLNERLKSRLKKPAYDPNADDDELGSKSILAKYDEEIDGKKKKHFTLDGSGNTKEQAAGLLQAEKSGSRGLQFNLDILQHEPPKSDYMDISEIKIKKPKKKKDKSKRHRTEDEEDIFPANGNGTSVSNAADTMELDMPQANGGNKRKHEDTSFVDDEDLQSSLANQRMAALKKRKRARPEDLARQLREDAITEVAAADEMESAEEGGLVIDETSEFVANLQKPKASEEKAPRATKSGIASQPPPKESDGDVAMQQDSDTSDSEGNTTEPNKAANEKLTATGLADEENLNNAGIGATMGLLKQRGLVKGQDGADLNTAQSAQAQFVKHKERLEKEWERKAQEKRKRDREMGLFDRMSKRQQEEYAQQENKMRDQYVSRQLDELFNREYKPNIELKYIDEFGRRIDSREAFKQMSHQFHGKGSGKQKTEKRLKKIAEEQEREARSNLDGSQMGLNNAAGTQAKKQGAAGVRLQ